MIPVEQFCFRGESMQKTTHFNEKMDRRMVDANTLLCVGLDPNLSLLPEGVSASPEDITSFCKAIIDATHAYAAVYKPNLAFFTQLGRRGLDVLADVRAHIPADIPVMLDCKVGDIGETARAYAHSWFTEFDFDAITVNPYLGEDAVAPFLAFTGKGVIIVCKTSNPGSGDFQDQVVNDTTPLFLRVASACADWDKRYPADVGLVVGATYPDQLLQVRSRVGDQPILLPGVGAQGGDIASALRMGLDSNERGLMLSASRSINHASMGHDFAEQAEVAARSLRDEINALRLTSASV